MDDANRRVRGRGRPPSPPVARPWGSVTLRAALKNRISAEPGLHADLLADPREMKEAAEVLCTPTPSREPVVKGAWLHPGTHVNAVGAPPRPDTRRSTPSGSYAYG
ncbi:hypothetical protein ACIOKD_36540 [Streptomyces sp. NPDC087844]|uniref:hypothetical protein n=1 Tax=Streptomyces sp. NPDC087844 TaxID=3365805 RepID=UPI00380E65D6